jgi:hypothetical protein
MRLCCYVNKLTPYPPICAVVKRRRLRQRRALPFAGRRTQSRARVADRSATFICPNPNGSLGTAVTSALSHHPRARAAGSSCPPLSPRRGRAECLAPSATGGHRRPRRASARAPPPPRSTECAAATPCGCANTAMRVSAAHRYTSGRRRAYAWPADRTTNRASDGAYVHANSSG